MAFVSSSCEWFLEALRFPPVLCQAVVLVNKELPINVFQLIYN